MNACQAVQDLLSPYLLTALGDSEQALVTAHLAECDACQAAQRETKLCVDLIAAPPVKPPAELWGKICATIDRTESGTDPVRAHDPDVVISLSCSFCRGGMTRPTAVYCASCLAPHHPECFSEHGRCSVMGCGETTIVRPSELPPLPAPAPAPAPVPAGPSRAAPSRFKLLLGGLASVVVGGVAAAALIQREQDAATQTSSEQRSAFDFGDERYRIIVREATLEELIAEIEHATKAHISIPAPSRRARIGNILIRERTWERAHWVEVLTELAAEHGLTLSRDPKSPDRARLEHGARYSAQPPLRPPSQISVRRSYHLKAGGKTRLLHEGWDYRVLAAPQGPGVAIVDRDRIDVFSRGKPVGSTRQLETPPRGATWSSNGMRLAYAYNTRDKAGKATGNIGVFLLRVERSKRNNTYLHGYPPVPSNCTIAWLEESHAIAVATETGAVKVSLVGGSGLHLEEPRPGGRLELFSLGENKILAARRDKIEAFQFAPLEIKGKRTLETSTLAHGYRVEVTPGSKRALVRTQQLFALLDVNSPSGGLQSVSLSENGLANLSPSGAFVAWRRTDGAATFVRHIGGPTGWDRLVLMNDADPPQQIEPAGFRWVRFDGEALLYWSEDKLNAVWFDLDKRGVPSVRSRWGPMTLPGTITDAQWAGNHAVVTVEEEKRREAITQVRRVD